MEIINGVKRKTPNPTNWKFSTLRENKGATKDTIPIKADLKGCFPLCYMQRYGNCTSNAVLAIDAYYYHGNEWVPSTVFTYWIQRKLDGALKEPDDGSTVETALDAVRKYGACNSKVWPNSMPYTQKPSAEAFADGLKGHEVTKYYNVKSVLQVKKAIAAGCPVACSMTWAFKSVDANGNLNTPTDKEIKKCNLGHAVVIVGYDERRIEIRNSWGTSWGNHGYAYIPYEVFKKIVWWEDTYAVRR